MNYYKKLEKSRYARIANGEGKSGGARILCYRGKNPLFIGIRKLVKAIRYLKIMNDDKLYISNLAVVTSFACDLNCEGCGQHTPLIKKLLEEQKKIDMEQIKKDLAKISSVVDGVGGYALANGEGFLNEGLSELIDYYASDLKVHYLNVPSNGTVIPDEKILFKMKKNNVSVTITKYDCVPDGRRKRVEDMLKRHGIEYTVFYNRKWYLHEYLEEEICGKKEAAQKYKVCERFFMLLQGRLYKCETNATGIMAGLRPEREGDSICVKDASEQELKDFIREKNGIAHLESCLHCRGGVGSKRKEIPAGKQLGENTEE